MSDKEKSGPVGSWQCPSCEAIAGTTWCGFWPKDEDAPTCCDGYSMLPYRIPSQEERDIKTVSRWISDIEAEGSVVK